MVVDCLMALVMVMVELAMADLWDTVMVADLDMVAVWAMVVWVMVVMVVDSVTVEDLV